MTSPDYRVMLGLLAEPFAVGPLDEPDIAAPTVGDYVTEALADSPLGLWLFDETTGTTATDLSAHGRHGTYARTYVLDADGPTDQLAGSVQFDGGGRVQLPTVLGGHDTITIEFWIRYTGGGVNTATGMIAELTSTSVGKDAFAVLAQDEGETVTSTVRGVGVSNHGTGLPPMVEDEWQFWSLVLTRESPGTLSLQIDGEEQPIDQSTATGLTGAWESPETLYVGQRGSFGQAGIHARFAGFAIYPGRLDDTRRRTHYLAARDETPEIGGDGWVDITDAIIGPGGPELVIEQGRDVDGEITPGTLTFSTYIGPESTWIEYPPGLPIRVTVDGERIFTGWLADVKRTPAPDGGVDVTFEAHDVLGLAAIAGDLPDTFRDLALEALFPETFDAELVRRWVPGVSGWVDHVSRGSGRHSSPMGETDEPVVDGSDSNGWRSGDTPGFGTVPGPLINYDLAGGVQVLTMLVSVDRRIEPGERWTIVHDQYHGVGGSGDPCHLEVVYEHQIGMESPRVRTSYQHAGGYGADHGDVELVPGRPLIITVVIHSTGSRLYLEDQHHRWWIPPYIGVPPATIPGHRTGPAITTIGGRPGHPDPIAVHDLTALAVPTPTPDIIGSLHDGLRAATRNAHRNTPLHERLILIAVGAGIPLDWLNLTPSTINTPHPYQGGDPLAAIRAIAATEAGDLHADRHGRLTYLPRRHTPPPATTLTDNTNPAPGQHPMIREAVEVADATLDTITNTATATTIDGTTATAHDQASIDQYGQRSTDLSGLYFGNHPQTRALAEWTVYTRSQPRPFVTTTAVDAHHDDTTPAALTTLLEQGDVVTIDHDDTTVDSHIVGIRHAIGVDRHDTTYRLDPHRHGHDWFLIEDTPIGDLALTL